MVLMLGYWKSVIVIQTNNYATPTEESKRKLAACTNPVTCSVYKTILKNQEDEE